MSGDATDPIREMVEAVYRTESRRVLATLIRLLGDFELAEEATARRLCHGAGALAAQTGSRPTRGPG